MRMTLNTDASYWQSGSKKIGGFAFWIKCDKFTFKGSGKIASPENSSDAELKAICNALYLLKKYRDVDNISTFYINTDSKYAIQRIKTGHNDEVTGLIWEILNSFNVGKVEVRHVKAHQHTRTARHYVNQWCDDMAKIEMRKQRI